MKPTALALAALCLSGLAACQPPPVAEVPAPGAFPPAILPPPPTGATAAEFEGAPPPSAFDDPQTIGTALPPPSMPPEPEPTETETEGTDPVPLFEMLR